MKKLTDAQAHRAVNWFAAKMGLVDWSFEVKWGDPPEWVVALDTPVEMLGKAYLFRNSKTAYIWLNTSGLRRAEEDPIATLFHECCHVLACDLDIEDDGKGRFEYTWNRLSELMLAAYRAKC